MFGIVNFLKLLTSFTVVPVLMLPNQDCIYYPYQLCYDESEFAKAGCKGTYIREEFKKVQDVCGDCRYLYRDEVLLHKCR